MMVAMVMKENPKNCYTVRTIGVHVRVYVVVINYMAATWLLNAERFQECAFRCI